MADAYKCDICKTYKDGIPKPTGKYGIFDMDKKASESLHLCPTYQAKFDRLFNGKPRKKKARRATKAKTKGRIRGRSKKQAEAPAKKKRAKAKKEKPKENPRKLITNEKSQISPDARSIRMKFISKRRTELSKQGYNREETWDMASKEYNELKRKNEKAMEKAKETYIFPEKEDGRKARMKFLKSRRDDLVKEGYSKSQAWLKAKQDYRDLKAQGSGESETEHDPAPNKNGISGSSKCQSCSEHVPKGDKYCPTCNMVLNDEAESLNA
jgi:hypothetical protein